MKVSFDFDSTLSRKDVQRFAKELVAEGHEVWIVTSRQSNEDAALADLWVKDRVIRSNKKLFRIADNVGIKREHIIFCNFAVKLASIIDQGFAFHLDDDPDELVEILFSTDPCKAINVEHSEWEIDCKRILKQKDKLL
jgi:hypothetical protein